MRKSLQVLLLLLLTASTSFTQERVVERISVLQHPYYAPNVLPAINNLMSVFGRAKINHFYVGRVEVRDDGRHSVLVYWKEKRALILWEPGRGSNSQGEADPKFDLAHTRRYWRLNKDVVRTLDDVGGSSFLITRQDAREWIEECVRHGVRFTINRSVRKRRRTLALLMR